MFTAVISVFILALLAPWIQPLTRNKTGWVLAALPLAITAYFATWIGHPTQEFFFTQSRTPWFPALEVNFDFALDGLALLFTLLITGIGTLILIYSAGYLEGNPHQGRFYGFLLMFMASMLGLVLADNVILVFIFWELTSLSSYFLIGFEHERKSARTAALQALLVTALGGLALLAGLLLMGFVGGSFQFSELLQSADTIRQHQLATPILLLILLAAFTKSAQFPFHVWLPNAMEAPTPVSAYLHSSTMVKAGIFLLARVSPVFAENPLWQPLLISFGAVTMLLGAYLAFRNTQYKRILAYSTISSLGIMTMLLGIGTSLAVKAALTYLLAHALFKGALFLVAGAVDHETGERNTEKLGGLRTAMPLTTLAAGLAALSLAGIPPLLGYVGKELLLEVVWETHQAKLILTAATVVASIFTVTVAAIVGFQPFFGETRSTPKHPHEAPLSMWLGPGLLALAGIVTAVLPHQTAEPILSPAVSSVLAETFAVKLKLWHGITPPLIFSGVAVLLGAAVYFLRQPLRKTAGFTDPLVQTVGPAAGYEFSLKALNSLARIQTKILQSGYLRFYLIIVLLTTVGTAGYALFGLVGGFFIPPDFWSDVHFFELGLAGLIVLATAAAVHSRSRLAAIAAMGVVGYGMSLIFVIFSAPDLAMTQFVIETLTVILFVLVFYHLPQFTQFSTRIVRIRDMAVALSVGGLMTTLVLMANNIMVRSQISEFFKQHSLEDAHGRNVVNVILVDFRSLDTLGEITVLAVAGIGVYALLKLRLTERGQEK